ncbi:MAG TPA: DNA polymerase/3'-5' exonuclease PolX [Thiobacillaceae bacterium]|nr:DNA polymerase/3'-5' exonuclease PolX [Thiobacillaceae bacterium]
MPIHNADIAAQFEELANLLEIQGANPFRIRAYHNAARTLAELGWDIRARLQAGEGLPKLPGVGGDLAAKVEEIVSTGHLGLLDRMRREFPPAVTELLRVRGLGPRRVKMLYDHLDVQTVEQLYRAARDGRIRDLPGFGEKTELKILQAVEAHVSKARRFKLAVAAQYAESLAAWLRQIAGVEQVVIAGSYRRMRDTVGDIDILVTARQAGAVIAQFHNYEEVAEVLSAGSTRASVVLRSGLQVDLRVVGSESFGAALHYFTGSKPHNIAIRRLGQERGLKINEYGVYRDGRQIAGASEESVYAAVGLPYIPPELRENRGEIEAARAGRLPRLIELADLRGDLHSHTKATDGRNSLREMALAAKARRLEYLAITDHSRHLTVARGLDPTRLAAQLDEIDGLNAELGGITLLKGIEVEILEDGSLDLPDELLGHLDVVVGAVHNQFRLSRTKQTGRILKAMDHPYFTILAHPSGRLIEERDPYDVDMSRVIRAARQRGCALEVNAQPDRLDLLDIYCQMAKAEGVKLAIDSDAHSALDFDNLRFGVGQARRGWLEREDVLNTRSLAELKRWLKGTRAAAT